MKLHQNNGKSAGFLRVLPPPVGRGFAFVISFICVCNNLYAESVCPTGMVPYTGPAITQMENLNGECTDLCDAGVRAIVAENGTRIDLFKTASTTRKLATKYNDMVCYADMPSGSQAGTLNVDVDGTAYYVAPTTHKICTPSFTLNYDCGGDYGTPPESQTIRYGSAFGVGHTGGTCYRDGYYISGWKIDGTTYNHKSAPVWKWASDMTATAVWSQRLMYWVRLCNDCEYPWVKGPMNVKNWTRYGSNFTPGAPSEGQCQRPAGAVFKGYDVYSMANQDLGLFIPAGQSAKFQWPHNIVLRAVWEWDRTVDEGEYQLTFDCGTDDDGNKYGWGEDFAITVGYNELFSPVNYNTRCSREGYYISGWTVGDTETVIDPYTAIRYSWKADTTLHAIWTPETYIIAYDCTSGWMPSDERDMGAQVYSNTVLTIKYGDTITPDSNACGVATGWGSPCEISGWVLYGDWGWDWREISAGESFRWNYSENATLSAVWSCPE